MKKRIIFSVLFFIIFAISSFGQGEGRWIEQNFDPVTGLRTGKIEVHGNVYEIKPEANLAGVDLRYVNLIGANLENATLKGADLRGADITDVERFFPFIEGHPFNDLIVGLTRGNYYDKKELQPILEALGQNDTAIGEQFTALGQNDISIGEQMATLGESDQSISEQMTILGQNDQSISEQMATLSENDQSIMAEINAMKAQLQTLVAQVAEKDQRIAELEQGGGGQSLEQVLEQVRDARAGSVVLTVDPEGDTVTLGLTIEQSDNLIEWTKLDGEMTRTIPIPDGKKFYRFALDK